jgi:FtsH-binding integral membrane protein
MSYSQNPYQSPMVPMDRFAAQAAAGERTDFITKTYLHLAGAIGLFVALEAALLSMPGVDKLVEMMMFGSRYSWLIVLGAFMLVSWVAESWARSAVSQTTQYLGLGLYVFAEAVIFVPLLFIATNLDRQSGTHIVSSAAVATLGLFAILTATVLVTRKDFSFLRGVLWFGGLAAVGFVLVAVVFQFDLGPIFIYAVIALACGYILFHTSEVMHHYRIGQHVAAALALFAAVALLFWYIVLLFMRSRD